MGPTQSLYCEYNLAELQYSDMPSIRYLWADRNIQNKQNQLYLNKFRQEFLVNGYPDLQTLRNQVQAQQSVKLRMRAICSASLDDDVYRYIQTKFSIDRAMLFCGNKTKASILMRDFSKIKVPCFGFPEVIRMVKQWEREQTESIYFFNPQQIHKLNLAVANWRALTDIEIAFTPESVTNFIRLAEKMYKSDDEDVKGLKQKIERAQKSKQTPDWLVEYTMINKYLLRQINAMLKSTNDPTKLAYLRWPIYTLFNSIKKYYQKTGSPKNKSYFGTLELSESQKKRLVRDQYICINQFIATTSSQEHKQDDKSRIYIKIEIPSKGNICNGFFFRPDGAVFNLGNFYKIQSFQNNLLTLSLIALTDKTPIKQGDINSGIFLSQVKAEKMQITKQGQWYSLFLNGKEKEAEQYIQRVNQLKKKRNQHQDIVRFTIIRQKVKAYYGKSLVQSIKKLEQIQKEASFQEKIVIYLTIAELYIFNKNFGPFKQTFAALQTCLSKQSKKSPINKELVTKIQLMRNWFKALNPKISQQEMNQLIKYFQLQEEQLISNDSYGHLNKTYLLCLVILSCCFQKISKYNQQIYTLNRILEILGWTEGRQSYQFKHISKYKRAAFEARNSKENEQQLQKKKKLKTTNLPIQELLSNDKPLKIDLSMLNMALYD